MTTPVTIGKANGQNRSTAVMQRRVEAHDSLDDFPTPPWATRALCEWLKHNASQPLDMFVCREPAANRGHMVKPLAEYFAAVEGSDVHDYGANFERLFSKTPPTHVLQFTERVVMHKGRLAPEGSTATAYAWLVWMGDSQTRLHWIAPCRRRLERASDYEAAA